jgi:hypothetical protein
MKVLRPCLLLLLVKKCWTEGKALGIKEGKAMGSGLFFGYASKESI